VKVKVRDSLTCGLPDIDAEVVAVGWQTRIDRGTHCIDRSEEGSPLIGRCIEPSRNVAIWDDERVPCGDWKTIP
jgi:hypothetical protein